MFFQEVVMSAKIRELQDLLIHTLDPTTLLDLLQLDMADLVEILQEQIEENEDTLWDAVA